MQAPQVLTANWLDWYHSRHQQECIKSGTLFEEYVAKVLARFHDDFMNPAPAGRLGDGGCDGLAESGTIAYACYGQRPGRNAEGELAKKISSDFARALDQWTTFSAWRFVTNAPVGPVASRVVVELQQAHGHGAARPLTIRLFNSEKLWHDVVATLDIAELNELFPGVPGIENIELEDLIPLLDSLGTGGAAAAPMGSVSPVPASKMDFNALPEASRAEFNYGRLLAPRIDQWYAGSADPGLYDLHGERFRVLYEEMRAVTPHPAEILERLYVAVAGPNVRMDGRRANAAFAAVSYFFDSCHIFEMPPDAGPTTDTEEVSDAFAH